MDHILVSIEYIKMINNQMRSIISVTVHLSGVPEVLYNTVLWLCECSGLESALSLKCLASRYLKSVQSALSDLKRLPERLQSQCNYRPFIT